MLEGTGVEIRAKNGGFVVERKVLGVVSERYYTEDLTKPRKHAPWSQRVVELTNQPSANVVVEVPPVPQPTPNVWERLAETEMYHQMCIDNILALESKVLRLEAALREAQPKAPAPAKDDDEDATGIEQQFMPNN